MANRNVGILIFDGAEVLDFAGPFEVFSVTAELHDFNFFQVFTVSGKKGPIRAVNGLSVNPDYDFDTCPPIDILIIAGGSGTRELMHDKATLRWIEQIHEGAELTVSICSGARLLGVLGLLDGKQYCTHHQVYAHMQELVPTGIPAPDQRFINAGNIYTSGGISAGIDLSFHLIEHLLGAEVANRTAAYMEYTRGV